MSRSSQFGGRSLGECDAPWGVRLVFSESCSMPKCVYPAHPELKVNYANPNLCELFFSFSTSYYLFKSLIMWVQTYVNLLLAFSQCITSEKWLFISLSILYHIRESLIMWIETSVNLFLACSALYHIQELTFYYLIHIVSHPRIINYMNLDLCEP